MLYIGNILNALACATNMISAKLIDIGECFLDMIPKYPLKYAFVAFPVKMEGAANGTLAIRYRF